MTITPIQQALDADWDRLDPVLQRHYSATDNTDHGRLDIEYPGWMQWPLDLLHAIGALLNTRGRDLAARVDKTTTDGRQLWRRRIELGNGRQASFDSQWIAAGPGCIIEFVNPLLGLKMSVRADRGCLYYEGKSLILRIGPWLLPLPENLLGHTLIVEQPVDEERFQMDFTLTHPWLGQIYRYTGVFRTDTEY